MLGRKKLKSWSPGVPESRSPGVPESRSHGVTESRSFLVRYRRTYVLNKYKWIVEPYEHFTIHTVSKNNILSSKIQNNFWCAVYFLNIATAIKRC